MNYLIAPIFLLASSAVFAQAIPKDLPKEVQAFLGEYKQLSSCMKGVNEYQMKRLEQQTKSFDKRLKQLCKSGERKEAKKYMFTIGKTLKNNPTLKITNQCYSKATSLEREQPLFNKLNVDSKTHVCDQI